KFQTLESVEVVPGDLLLTMMGTIGKVAVVPPSIRRSIMDSHLLRMRPDQRVIRTDYLAWAIQGSTAVLDAIEAQAHGAIMKGLNSAIVRSLPVPVPPLAEQQQIVGKLEEAFDGLAIATANAERNLRNARALFESHLESVFTRRGDSPVVPIGDVAEVFDGPHATPKTVDAGPVFLGISALQDGKINLGETRHVTLQDFRQWTRRVKPQSDDVVFSYETRLGQAAIIPEGLECCLGRRMGLVRVNRKRVDPRFFVYQYISPPFRKFVDSKTVRGATVDRIALKEFPSFPISLPSLSEQERMTNRLDKLRAETQRLESICRQKLAALGELKKSLLHQAFSGQL
ncbi:MAG: restriction endonuclease subunit S, partial [Nitrospira sp.]